MRRSCITKDAIVPRAGGRRERTRGVQAGTTARTRYLTSAAAAADAALRARTFAVTTAARSTCCRCSPRNAPSCKTRLGANDSQTDVLLESVRLFKGARPVGGRRSSLPPKPTKPFRKRGFAREICHSPWPLWPSFVLSMCVGMFDRRPTRGASPGSLDPGALRPGA
jgi:hypothetical protein